MDLQRIVSPKTVLILLLLVVGLEVAALLIYVRLDSIIHSDLYRHGLIFSIAWAMDYWMSNVIVLGTLVGSVILTGFALFLRYLYSKDHGVSSRWACILCPAIAGGFAAVSLYFVWRIDSIVHVTLYQYGLQFSEEWAAGYWTIFRATLGLGGAAIAFLALATFVTWVVTRD